MQTPQTAQKPHSEPNRRELSRFQVDCELAKPLAISHAWVEAQARVAWVLACGCGTCTVKRLLSGNSWLPGGEA